MRSNLIKAIIGGVFAVSAISAHAEGKNGCGTLPNNVQLKAALIQAVADETSGLDLQMWVLLLIVMVLFVQSHFLAQTVVRNGLAAA